MNRALSPKEILELDRTLQEAFGRHLELRRSNPVAQHIKFPPVPSILSESIVLVAAPKWFGHEWQPCPGGRASDIILRGYGGDWKLVAVKATASHGFQELKERDLKVDYLVWIHFGDRYLNGGGPITAYVLESPGIAIVEPTRLHLIKFVEQAQRFHRLTVHKYATLEQIIS